MSPSLIQINLSNVKEAKRHKRPQQNKASNIIGVIASIIIILVAAFYLYVSLKMKTVKQLENDYGRIEKTFVEANKLSELNNKLKGKVDTLSKCRSERIDLADIWLELAKLTPENIYLTAIEMLPTDKQADIQKMVINARAENSVDESAILHFLDLLEKNTKLTNSFKAITLSAVYSDGDEKAFSIELLESKINKKK